MNLIATIRRWGRALDAVWPRVIAPPVFDLSREALETARRRQAFAVVQAERVARENMFGKIRGRFDEAAARASDRMLPERAIGVIVPMPAEEFDAFVRLFNDIFGRDGRPRRFQIREMGR